MKLNKKVLCLSAAAMMAVSAVGASAATLPIPKSNNEAFKLAESFYYDGLYYEAKAELDYVKDVPEYDKAKAEAWNEKVDYAISRMEIKSLLKKVQTMHDKGLYYQAQDAIDALNARTDITQDDYYAIRWWEEVVADKIAKLEGKAVVVVRSGASAINRVKATGFKLSSNYEWYSPVKVEGGYHVYVKTQLPGGGSADVAAFRVSTNGDVERAF